MKYLLNINEMVKNKELVRSYVIDMFSEINKFFKLKSENIIKEDRNNKYFFSLRQIPIKFHDKIMTILSKYKVEMLEDDIIMSYRESKTPNLKINDKPGDFNIEKAKGFTYEYYMYFKDMHTMEIKPNEKIYHFSPIENRESILKYGLLLKESKNSELWSHDIMWEYPPCIFASNKGTDYGWYYKERDKIDMWEIDTTNLPNKWWHDLNVTPNKGHIMTFEPIPPQYLKLIKK